MYGLLEYSGNYGDTSGSLWQFNRDELNLNTNIHNQYKSSYVGSPTAAGAFNGVKIAVPLNTCLIFSDHWRYCSLTAQSISS